MAIRLREYVFGNWRNQGVALFFAVTIWYVAYKSETQSEAVPVRLVLIARPEGQVIIRQECFDSKQELVPFNPGNVILSVTGPRKQIEKLRGENNIRDMRFPVDAGTDPESRRKKIELTGAAFAAIAPGVKITSITPEAIFLTFDTAEEREFNVEPIYQLLPEGMEAEPPRIDPATVPLYGPRSLLKEVRVTAEPRLGWDERFDDTVPLNLRYPDTLDKALVEKIHFVGPTRVRLSVRLRYKNDFLDAEGVRVRFLIPAGRFPFQVQFPDEGIAVRFQGPLQEIRRLRDRVKSPDFALAVTVPTMGAGGEQTIPFTEDGILLYGASERVQIRQHPLRQAQGKGAWTYSLVPVPVPSPAESK